MSERYRIDRAWLRTKRKPKTMPGAHQNSLRSYLAIPQGTARVRASSIEDINSPVNPSDTHRASEDLAHLDFTRHEIAFPDQTPPLYRKYTAKHHDIYCLAVGLRIDLIVSVVKAADSAGASATTDPLRAGPLAVTDNATGKRRNPACFLKMAPFPNHATPKTSIVRQG